MSNPRSQYGSSPFGGGGGGGAPRYSGGGGGGGGGMSSSYNKNLQPTKNAGGNAFAFGNLAAVSTMDFQGVDQTLVNASYDGKNFVLMVRAIPECQPGTIGLTEFQRAWMKVSLGPNSYVQVSLFTTPIGTNERSSIPFAGRLDVDVNWARLNQTTEEGFPQHELAAKFLQNHDGQVFQTGQPVGCNFQGLPSLVFTVVNLFPLDFGTEKPNPVQRAVISPSTELVFRNSVARLVGGEGPAQAENSIISANFNFADLGIGGLDKEFSVIFRKAFASRLLKASVAQKAGLQHVRGMLLYGPPGTGKTLIARQISKALNTRPPKIINGPEVLNKYVGQSEENVRKIFEDAEKEYKAKGDQSGLHIIIFDELDAVCKQRGSGAGGGTGVGDTIVNQLLTKLDGVEQLNNILLIGMTNRKDMIDEALLRPGRMEVHVEVSLPDEAGRIQIINIHTQNLKKSNFLGPDVDIDSIAKQTKNYSGAEIAGLVRAASSFALQRMGKEAEDTGDAARMLNDLDGFIVNMPDFQAAIDETTPMFGVDRDFSKAAMPHGIIYYDDHVKNTLRFASGVIKGIGREQLATLLLWGPIGSGKTALATKIALDSEAPFIQLIDANAYFGMSELQKIQAIEKTFRDADRVSIL
jgi:vesicle-fusing ATPase